jgi:hypothetical protein
VSQRGKPGTLPCRTAVRSTRVIARCEAFTPSSSSSGIATVGRILARQQRLRAFDDRMLYRAALFGHPDTAHPIR